MEILGLAAINGADLEENDDQENPVVVEFHPETALIGVYRGLGHPALALGFTIYPSVFTFPSVFLGLLWLTKYLTMGLGWG